MEAVAKAHTNIALIKYWGKRDEELFLPMNSSLSITLDKFYTTTAVEFCSCLKEDIFILNGERASEAETRKITRFLDKIREKSGKQFYAIVDSTNKVKTAAGFASSASGYAALATAAANALDVELDNRELSMLARQGSGSATRSIYGGFVEWQKGEKSDGSDSFAVPILDAEEWDLSILSVLIKGDEKKVLSREGMRRTVETSPFYAGWLQTVEDDLIQAKEAIHKRDFEQLGMVLEYNGLKMHGTILGAKPPFWYWQSGTLTVMEEVQRLRENGIEAYFTIDAGPNVKVICERKNEDKVEQYLSTIPEVEDVIVCHPGPGVELLNEEDYFFETNRYHNPSCYHYQLL